MTVYDVIPLGSYEDMERAEIVWERMSQRIRKSKQRELMKQLASSNDFVRWHLELTGRRPPTPSNPLGT